MAERAEMTAHTEQTVLEAERSGSPEVAADPCVMVVFGASGDLTRKDLLPSIFELAARNLLPDRFALLGLARSEWSDEEFRRRMRQAVEEGCDFDRRVWDRLAPRIHYQAGDLTTTEDYERLGGRIEELRDEHGIPGNAFFHLATPPSLFGTIAGKLGDSGLARRSSDHSDDGDWRRLVIEKPFGEDRASARALDRELRSAFDEEQIYRIDHYLGKETVQNMLVFRFANPAFEPIWNRDFIDHVQITASEDIGIGTRARFYEKTGVVRDMVQNHLLQLLCMTAVDPPVYFDGASLRDETVKVLRSVRRLAAEDCVLGQYGPGVVEGEEVPGYRAEKGVDDASTTPTFAALRLELDSWRWAGVPFYLRTGKRLARKLTEVAVFFKPTPHLMFPLEEDRPIRKNVLVFRLQPQEGILQTFIAKQPGPDIRLTPVTSRFLYADAFGGGSPPRAYAWLLLDVMQGNQTLFARADWIDQAWSIVDPIVERHESGPPDDLPNYRAGTWGPDRSHDLLEREGRSWRALQVGKNA